MAKRVRDRDVAGDRDHDALVRRPRHYPAREPAGAGHMNRQMPALLKPFVALTYVLLLTPLVIVVAVSFGASPNFDFPPPEVALKWYRAFFDNAEFVRAFFQVSLVLGISAAIIACALGIL